MTEPKQRVLIIEDDTDMIELLTLILKRGGYQPIAALGGVEGLRMLRDGGADLILLDLMMEDINGWVVLEAIRADEKLCHIPVLIVSAQHYLEDGGQARANQDLFEGYLVKPFIMKDLLTQITEALE
ncbi:MAG: response regulator [Anaerolineae bacterium]|nr:response regulator [Anaerolineae bacterium]